MSQILQEKKKFYKKIMLQLLFTVVACVSFVSLAFITKDSSIFPWVVATTIVSAIFTIVLAHKNKSYHFENHFNPTTSIEKKEFFQKHLPFSYDAYKNMLKKTANLTFDEAWFVARTFNLPLYSNNKTLTGSYATYIKVPLTELQANILIKETVIALIENQESYGDSLNQQFQDEVSQMIVHISSNKDSAKALVNDIPELTKIRDNLKNTNKELIHAHVITYAIEEAFEPLEKLEKETAEDNNVSDFGDTSYKL